jgi:tetratricopeptide (TPR) repeat protein
MLIILGIYVNYAAGFWPAFPLYLVGFILIIGHFLFGPLRLIQEYMEEGNMEGAEKVLNAIQFPNLLIKPIRSVYYTLKGNMAMMKQDFDTAEKNIKKGTDLMGNSSLMQGQMKQAEGANKLQLGMLAMQKNDLKGAEAYIRAAIRSGLPDKESEAAAYLQMCSLMMNKREFRAAKDFFRKAKALKPTSAQILDQIKQIEKYITRMPG